MRPHRFLSGCATLALTLVSACASVDHAVAPGPVTQLALASAGGVVVSQVYGGGGNSGATYKNDFVELYNAGTTAVSLTGWSVQYASTTGSSWQVTPLAGKIQPGAYYLVQESQGAAGTTPLPTPDVVGTINMSATAAKVALVNTSTALTGSCPLGATATIVDFVGYGSTTTCYEGTGAAATLTNTTAALRKNNGQQNTNDNSADFTAGAPTPRNSGVVTAPTGAVATVTVTPSPASVLVGGTVKLSATAADSAGNLVATSFAWTSSNASIASVDSTGLVRGLAISSAPVTITATSANKVAGTSAVTVVAPGAIASVGWSGTPTATTVMPAGFQTQLFTPVARDIGGNVVQATFTFTALDPSVATILAVGNSGIITGVSGASTNPRFQVTATPIGGGTSYVATTAPVTVQTPVFTDSAGTYANNAEFGLPSAATNTDYNNLLVARSTYTASYNASRGTPNWVSYELDRRQSSTGQDRCNCFTAEPMLPAALRVYTSDYTNGGYDRGHMTRSADRTLTNGENARTYYLSNVVPQTADLNQGVWAAFENQLADSAAAGRAVYIIAGPLFSASAAPRYIKQDSGQTKIRIPDSTWKVAFIGPYSLGHAFQRGDIRSWDDLAGTTVLAVNMPNVAGVLNDPPSKYATTVQAIEASTGYGFLSLLPTAYRNAIEVGDHPPVPVLNGPSSSATGQPVAFSAAGTSDPDAGDVLSYDWRLGNGATATGPSATATYAAPGTYTVTLTVTDRYGWAVTRTLPVAVGNAAPAVSLPNAAMTAAAGQPYNLPIAFVSTTANAAPFHLAVEWGDGAQTTGTYLTAYTAAHPLVRQHAYAGSGAYTVTVRVTDRYGLTSTPVTVQLTVP